AGASDVFERGFVSYSNRAKQEMLGVSGDMIADLGAVSEPIARMMAEGALENSHAHVSVAITGVAGPGGGTPLKPVGTVHLAPRAPTSQSTTGTSSSSSRRARRSSWRPCRSPSRCCASAYASRNVERRSFERAPDRAFGVS